MSSKSKSVLVTAKGFLVNIEFDMETKTYKYIFSTVLREAMFASTKVLVTKKEKHNLEGFIYNPFKEEPIRDKFEVYDISKSSMYLFSKEEKIGFGIRRAIMINVNDIKFLNEFHNEEKSWEKYHPIEEAKEIARQKNNELILKVQETLKEL